MDAKVHLDLNLALAQSEIDREWSLTLRDDGCQFLISKGTEMFDKQLQTWHTRRWETKDRIWLIGEQAPRTVLGEDFEDFRETQLQRLTGEVHGGNNSGSKRTACSVGVLDRTGSVKRPRNRLRQSQHLIGINFLCSR
jgi:hypothetical protein